MSVVILDIDDTVLRYGRTPINRTIEFLNSLPSDVSIHIVTGRYQSQAAETRRQLRLAKVPYDSITFRTPGDGERSATPYKAKTAKMILEQSKVLFAIENDANTRMAYRRLGIKALDPAKLPSPES